jgi:hypothetical protein
MNMIKTSDGLYTSFSNNGVFTNLTSGSYVVEARDAYKCISTTSLLMLRLNYSEQLLDSGSFCCYDGTNK